MVVRACRLLRTVGRPVILSDSFQTLINEASDQFRHFDPRPLGHFLERGERNHSIGADDNKTLKAVTNARKTAATAIRSYAVFNKEMASI